MAPPPPPRQAPRKPWHTHLTLDLVVRVVNTTLLSPFIAWMVPLCFRAQATPYEWTSMRVSVAYASLVTLLWLLSLLNERVAFGAPREVDLEEEVIVITGGAGGLGLLIAQTYGMRGASVAVLDVKENTDTAEARGVKFYKCDVGDREQVEAAAKRIEKDLGAPTILINNAGIVNGLPLLKLSPEQIEKTFRTNLLSHFYTIQTFLPGMIRKQGGTIVTVSSVLGYLGCRNLSDYTSSKAALLALHASLTAELSPHHPYIKTLLVTPGQIATPLFAHVKTPSSFLAPVLEPVDVAARIIAAVDAGEGGHLALPFYARWIQLMGVLPVGVQRVVRWMSGVDGAVGGLLVEKEGGEGRESVAGE
ncbi:MAG: hypothetical protein M1819_007006 [Sarea resinae]|nr:MAG: hypothetical protein M1819_007006 [Sarea resinae]